MPELPEVETTRRKIEPLLAGRTILEVTHDAPHRYRDTHLAHGRRVSGLSRRGKYLMLHLAAAEADGEEHDLIVHLGMTGGFRLEEGVGVEVRAAQLGAGVRQAQGGEVGHAGSSVRRGWHWGQKWVPRWASTVFWMGVPQRGQGFPVWP